MSFQDTRLVGMLQGRVCDTLAQCGFPGRYAFGVERIAFDRPEKSFIPGAGCDVAAQSVIEVESVPGHPISHQVAPGLDRRAGRYHDRNVLFAGDPVDRFDDFPIHSGLVVVVIRKSRMVGIAGISPDLMDGEAHPGIGCVCA